MEPEAVQDRYTKLAPHYDRMMSFWAPLDRWRRRAVAETNIRKGDTVLDIGCGTGKNFPFIEERIGPAGKLIGLDYTPAMLEQAARRVDEGRWKNVDLIEGQAEDVDRLVEGPFDGALSWCCLSIVPDCDRAIAAAASLLRPGGRFTVYDMRTTRAKGPLGWPLTRFAEWWVNHYGTGDPEADYAVAKPWKATMAKYLTGVTYREMAFGTLFRCTGQRPAASDVAVVETEGNRTPRPEENPPGRLQA